MYRLEIIDKNGSHEEKMTHNQYIDLALKKTGNGENLLDK